MRGSDISSANSKLIPHDELSDLLLSMIGIQK